MIVNVLLVSMVDGTESQDYVGVNDASIGHVFVVYIELMAL